MSVAPRSSRLKIGTRPFSGSRFVEGGKVRIEWFPGGGRRAMTIGPDSKANRKYADKVLVDALALARTGRDGQVSRRDVTLGELLALYLEDARSRRHPKRGTVLHQRTLELYHQHDKSLRAHFADKLNRPARQLCRKELKAFVSKMTGKWADKTIATVTDYLNAALTWAAAEEDVNLEVNPINGFKPPSRKGNAAAYSHDECGKLLRAIGGMPARSWRFKTLAILEAVYGARANQVINLEWTDLDFDKEYLVQLPGGDPVRLPGILTFRKEVLGSKGQDTRSMPMLPNVRTALLEAQARRRDASKYVLWGWSDSNKAVNYQSMNDSLRQLERLAGVTHIKGRSFHAFRRQVATFVTEKRGAKAAAEWIGNTLAATLAHYVKDTPTAQASAAQALLQLLQQSQPTPEPLVNRASAPDPENSEAASA